MRLIKFRGKSIMEKHELDYIDIPHFNRWVKGSLVADGNDFYIVGLIVEASDDGLIHEWWSKVQPESVGQYTGLKDKNGTEIYEGDYFKDDLNIWEVYFQDSCFVAKCLNGPFGVECLDEFMDFETHQYCDVEIIGNIYENSDLLEVE